METKRQVSVNTISLLSRVTIRTNTDDEADNACVNLADMTEEALAMTSSSAVVARTEKRKPEGSFPLQAPRKE